MSRTWIRYWIFSRGPCLYLVMGEILPDGVIRGGRLPNASATYMIKVIPMTTLHHSLITMPNHNGATGYATMGPVWHSKCNSWFYFEKFYSLGSLEHVLFWASLPQGDEPVNNGKSNDLPTSWCVSTIDFNGCIVIWMFRNINDVTLYFQLRRQGDCGWPAGNLASGLLQQTAAENLHTSWIS